LGVLTTIGLALILIGWIEQIYRSFARRHLSFSPFFLTLYVVGTGVLVYDSFTRFDALDASLNIVIAALAFTQLLILIYRRRKPPGAF
jgi:hypothetical protein